MKTNKSKSEKRTANKGAKKQIEKSLTEKFFEVVKTLGHNAEDIAEDIAKAGKAVAKKLSKKFKEVAPAVEQLTDKNSKLKKSKGEKVKSDKNISSKLKVEDKSLKKIAKQPVNTAVSTSVKVGQIATLEDANVIENSTDKIVSPKSKAMKSKSADEKVSEKKTVVKAVTSNPVTKVSSKSIPKKQDSDTTKK